MHALKIISYTFDLISLKTLKQHERMGADNPCKWEITLKVFLLTLIRRGYIKVNFNSYGFFFENTILQ